MYEAKRTRGEGKTFGRSPQVFEKARFGQGDPSESKPFPWIDLVEVPGAFAEFG
jgi:hypothetical protein